MLLIDEVSITIAIGAATATQAGSTPTGSTPRESEVTNPAEQIRDIRRFIHLPFAYNHWYVAGTREEFGRTPKARTLLDRSVVFFRTEAAELVALQNRCLHRSFPLSEGFVEGDQLVCRYHGIRYAATGSIARVPSQEKCPGRKLRSYPVREQGPFVFIWMGDEDHPGRRDAFPDLPFLADPSYRSVFDAMRVESSYLLMMENLSDLTHFAYLHKETFGVGDYFFDLEFTAEHTPEGVQCRFVDTDSDRATRTLPPEVREKLQGRPAQKWESNLMLSPGVCKGHAPVIVGDPESGDQEILEQYIMHFLTPETPSTSHYWWSISNDYALGNDDYYRALKVVATKGFEEDVWACREMQAVLDADGTEFGELSLPSDRAGWLFRRAMLDWVSSDRTPA